MGECTLALSFVLYPLPFVDSAFFVYQAPISLGHVVLPVALVDRAVGPDLGALALTVSFPELAFVDGIEHLEGSTLRIFLQFCLLIFTEWVFIIIEAPQPLKRFLRLSIQLRHLFHISTIIWKVRTRLFL
jgi:hypothetical protein